MSTEYSRKQFFRKMLMPGPGRWDPEPEDEKNPASEQNEPSLKPVTKERPWIRPPGALRDEKKFLAACTKCGECAKVCPHNAIDVLELDTGRAEQTPYIDPEENPCRWCADMPCITACETGALQKLDDDPIPAIATVKINLENCLTSHGVLCNDCYVSCPTSLSAIKMINRKPEIDANKCTGCGMCFYYCEEENAIQITPL